MMNIARLSEFGQADRRKTILLLAWQAREYLGDAERKEETSLSERAYWCSDAAALLEASQKLLDRETDAAVRHKATIAFDLMARALCAAKAAFENGQIAARYFMSSSRVRSPEWDKLHASKAISIFKRASEAARQETHRAMVELCELFPDAMPTEER
jgi:hypothetical protein